jgi:Flp pilus assembly pilin Flp
MTLVSATGRRFTVGSTPLGRSFVRLPRRLVKRMDVGANTAIESGLIFALIAVVLIAGVLAVVAIKISVLVHYLAGFVIH